LRLEVALSELAARLDEIPSGCGRRSASLADAHRAAQVATAGRSLLLARKVKRSVRPGDKVVGRVVSPQLRKPNGPAGYESTAAEFKRSGRVTIAILVAAGARLDNRVAIVVVVRSPRRSDAAALDTFSQLRTGVGGPTRNFGPRPLETDSGWSALRRVA
jgi:hypothetical protein